MTTDLAAVGVEGVTKASRRIAEQESLCAAQYRKLVGYLCTLVGDPGLAEELAQEAFVRLFARWFSVRHPQAYLYLTATNLARRHWRRRRSEDAALLLSAPRPGDQIAPAYDPALADALARLPRRQRPVVVLHYLADLPVADVGTLLHLAPGSVKRLLHDARARLATMLEDSRD